MAVPPAPHPWSMATRQRWRGGQQPMVGDTHRHIDGAAPRRARCKRSMICGMTRQEALRFQTFRVPR